MSKPSQRPTREARKVVPVKERRRAQAELSEKRAKLGYIKRPHTSIANHKSTYNSVEEEELARNQATAEHIEAIRTEMPFLLKRIAKIYDTRHPEKITYALDVLMLYGMISFILHMSSSRETTRKMTLPMFWANLQILFPEFANNPEAPHHCTLTRVLSQIDVNDISELIIALVSKWIKRKRFTRNLIDRRNIFAIDGTQKMCRDWLWDEECLQRTFNRDKDNESSQYYVYILQASLTLSGGMSIPIMSEFLSYSEGDSDRDKQDCETKAFYRLAARLKKAFPKLKIMLLLDGLYPTGPVFATCRKNNWEYMIVWQDKVLKSSEIEFEALCKLEPENSLSMKYNDRNQEFRFANYIDYTYGPNGKKSETIHAAECLEFWEEIEVGGTNVVEKSSKHRWISSEPLTKGNLHRRCNLCARARWTIETIFLIEKHHGYQFEHCFSYNWNAMKGYHYLMQLAHVFNVMARYSKIVTDHIKELGVRGFIDFIRENIAGPWLDRDWIRVRLGLAPSSNG